MKLPRIICLLSLMACLSLNVLADSTSADYGQLGFQVNELYIKNNLWGKGTITNYTANVWTSAATSDKYNWDCGANWSWPASSGVKSYQEMIYGYVGGGVYTIGTKLPTWLGAGKNIYIDWSYSTGSNASPKPIYNAALDVFLVKDNSGPGSTRQAELMVWLSSKNMTPAGTYQGDVTLAGTTYKVYYKNDMTDGVTIWKYVAYVRSIQTTSVTNLNLKYFTDHMMSKGWASKGQNIYSIEAGYEAVQGTGWATNFWYKVYIP
jgi:xyloglucan-specific endo-beta-1,4-glucanase